MEVTKLQTKLKKATETAKKAKEMRKQALKLQEKAVKELRDYIKEYTEGDVQLLQELKKQREELYQKSDELRQRICKLKRKHMYFDLLYPHYLKYVGYKRIEAPKTFGEYGVCVICGKTKAGWFDSIDKDDIRRMEKNIIHEIAQTEENPEIRQIAQQILEVSKQVEKLNEQIKSNAKPDKKIELCKMFGHNAECIDVEDEIFKCEWCGRTLDYKEYITAHYKAQFKGIIPYYYLDDKVL